MRWGRAGAVGVKQWVQHIPPPPAAPGDVCTPTACGDTCTAQQLTVLLEASDGPTERLHWAEHGADSNTGTGSKPL